AAHRGPRGTGGPGPPPRGRRAGAARSVPLRGSPGRAPRARGRAGSRCSRRGARPYTELTRRAPTSPAGRAGAWLELSGGLPLLDAPEAEESQARAHGPDPPERRGGCPASPRSAAVAPVPAREPVEPR